MEQRILEEKGDRDVSTIKELNLKNCKSSSISGLTEEWKNLEILQLNSSGLTSLKGFPRLPNLKTLELSDNLICDGLDALASLPKLENLDFSNNKIKDMEVFEPLSELSTLKSLKVVGCDICQEEDYKDKLHELISSLTFIDGEEMGKKKNGASQGPSDEGIDEEDLEDEDDSFFEGEEEVDEEEVEDDEEDEEEDIPLEALYDKIQDEGEEDDDFEAVEEDEDDEDIDDESEDETSFNQTKEETEENEEVRGTKRKCEEEH